MSEPKAQKFYMARVLRRSPISLGHNGHPGIERTKRRLKDLYWWPKMNGEIDAFVSVCSPCQASGKSFKPEPVLITAVPPPLRPFHKIGIDICGPFFTAPRQQRLIVLAAEDYFSKFPFMNPMGEVTSAKVIGWLEEEFSEMESGSAHLRQWTTIRQC